ncbi:hypothetical protein [Nocardioides massiliensis]|uniref:Membrane protein n=1 Tax=Nocardioides massiliensis TaxID=1325935 RepID=A0ABT9NQP3_9ACTN|nr:hypothetical protein [Nocardioides massiliensis]MDP9822125.1 putative membrane protein [Nocardioides massiliensis]
MRDSQDYTWAGPTPALPRSIWVVAWASLAGQLVLLLDRGVRSDNEVSIIGSVLLGMLLLGFVSAGVVRARTIRLVLAWIVLGLSALAETVALIEHLDGGALEDRESVLLPAALLTTVVCLVALWRFHQSAWFAWHRNNKPAANRPSITHLVAVGVLVGALGGLAGATDDGFEAGIHISATGQR